MNERIQEIKRRMGVNYDEKAARYDSIESLIDELVSRHRGDIPEAHAQALGYEAVKRVKQITKEWYQLRVMLVEVLKQLSRGINATPTGLARNRMTEVNIKALSLLDLIKNPKK